MNVAMRYELVCVPVAQNWGGCSIAETVRFKGTLKRQKRGHGGLVEGVDLDLNAFYLAESNSGPAPGLCEASGVGSSRQRALSSSSVFLGNVTRVMRRRFQYE